MALVVRKRTNAHRHVQQIRDLRDHVVTVENDVDGKERQPDNEHGKRLEKNAEESGGCVLC